MQLVIACGWVPLQEKLPLGVTLTLLAIPGRGEHAVYLLHSSFVVDLIWVLSLLPASAVQDESSLKS